MHYRVSGIEQRFQLLRIQIAGSSFEGVIETFYRPRPVKQRSVRDVSLTISRDAFSGHRALIIGGSRGLGELAAKIVAAGGADVSITYAYGRDDADRVCAEVRDRGFKCTARHLNVMSDPFSAVDNWLSEGAFTHVYYFASPHIDRHSGSWNAALFQRFSDIYVAAFAKLVDCVVQVHQDKSRTTRFLYPSSIFVSQPEDGFLEYAVAKGAGEILCDQLQSGRAIFSKPRLPRLLTDQTNSVLDIGARDPFPIILDVVRNFHS